MATLQSLEKEVNKIKERNRRVEREKAWEVSWIRRIMVVVLTYVVIAIFFIFIGTDEPLRDSIVPSAAFILSTLSGPFIKKLWLKYIYKK
ncbi:hypothetical protein HYU94_02065 [Candidatus Daviesbacteria bacterium]|nr:hypothetical protein [Candidatus Daviesbacteria bacterium]